MGHLYVAVILFHVMHVFLLRIIVYAMKVYYFVYIYTLTYCQAITALERGWLDRVAPTQEAHSQLEAVKYGHSGLEC